MLRGETTFTGSCDLDVLPGPTPTYDEQVAARVVAPPRPPGPPPGPDREGEPHRRDRRFNSTFGSVGLLVVVVVLWIVSMARLQLSAIGSYGLISALPVTMYLGLGILTASMVMAIHRGARSGLLAAHLVLFILMVHGTPALVYGTLRYAWAWKHLGIVYFFNQHHAVNSSAPGDLSVYQNWPGFFSTTTTWLVGSDLKSWTGMAQWAPPVFEGLFAFAVLKLLSTIENDRRLVWLAVWLFAIGNWVGQDYFSPQAFAYFLYLAMLVIIFRWLVRHPAMPMRLRGLVHDWPEPETTDDAREATPQQRRAAVFVVMICVTAIATSHPLTPLVVMVALVALALTKVLRVRSLPLIAAAPTVIWLLTGARTYTNSQIPSLITKIGALDSNVSQTLSKAANAAASQRIVSTLGRGPRCWHSSSWPVSASCCAFATATGTSARSCSGPCPSPSSSAAPTAAKRCSASTCSRCRSSRSSPPRASTRRARSSIRDLPPTPCSRAR